MYDKEKGFAINKDDYNDEVFKDFELNKDDYNFEEAKSVEVGDIYSLGEKFSNAIGLNYKDEEGKEKPVYMGSYGIGVPRVMGAIVEIFSDDKGMVWPESVAPFKYHLVELSGGDEEIKKKADDLYNKLTELGIEVLYDDRDMRPGEKFADSDLIGIPHRIVFGKKTTDDAIEVVDRTTGETTMISFKELLNV